jgi:hypothetical protein
MTHYCILPSGNQHEFPQLDAELLKRGVKASISDMSAGGRIYRFEDLAGLPSDEKGPYLGDDESGHSLYPLKDAEAIREELSGAPWRALTSDCCASNSVPQTPDPASLYIVR